VFRFEMVYATRYTFFSPPFSVKHIQNKKTAFRIANAAFYFLSRNFLCFPPYIFKDFVFCPKSNKLIKNLQEK